MSGPWQAQSAHGWNGHAVQANADNYGAEGGTASGASAQLKFSLSKRARVQAEISGTVWQSPYYGGGLEQVGFAEILLRKTDDAPSEFPVQFEDLSGQRHVAFTVPAGIYEITMSCSTAANGVSEISSSASAMFRVLPADLTCEQDLDGDGWVGTPDIGLMLLDWGYCPSCRADLNWDQFVDGSDLSELLVAFGPCAEPPDALAAPTPTPLSNAPAQKPVTAKKE